MKWDRLMVDLGCGFKKTEGYYGVDIKHFDGVDEVFDLTTFPWPANDGTVKRLICKHTLEHFTWPQVVSVMNECYRILVPEGEMEIVVPLFPSDSAVDDPDHKTFFSKEAFGRFEPENEYAHEMNIINRWRRLINDWTPQIVATETSNGLNWLFPCRRELHVVLKKL
jgi:predicted SAM-dependent methyltransferase